MDPQYASLKYANQAPDAPSFPSPRQYHDISSSGLHDLSMPSPDLGASTVTSSTKLYSGKSTTPRPRRHPFARNFEPPRCRTILIHNVLCVLSFPTLVLFTAVAKDKSLFWTRFLVGLGCGIVGFVLGLSLLGLGRPFLEAATWATVIHQSNVEGAPGVKLKVLAAGSSDPTSGWAALCLLWDRFSYHGTARQKRSRYDGRRWSIFILFFLIILAVATSIPFVLGRLINITATAKRQREGYEEVSIAGDNSDEDIRRASILKPFFQNQLLSWTLAPVSTHGGLPPALTFTFEDSLVYFSETSLGQLLPNGSGFGTFNTEKVDWAKQTGDESKLQQTVRNADNGIEPGGILRMPKWGTRLQCASLPDPKNQIMTSSSTGFTYIFTPTTAIQSLFDHYKLEYPTNIPKFNASQVLRGNDTLPSSISPDGIAIGSAFPDNGKGHSFSTTPVSLGGNGQGFITIEHVLVRLNTTFTPNGTFPVLRASNIPDSTGQETYIGYDAAVCLQLFESWVVEVYNSTTGVPNSIRVLGKGNSVNQWSGQGANNSAEFDKSEKKIGTKLNGPTVKAELNSTRLQDLFNVAHTNSINQMLKDNGPDAPYVPSQTVLAYTQGRGAFGYTSLSPTLLAQARGLADAANVLPYFTGTGQLLVRRFPDRISSSASFVVRDVVLYLVCILLMGMVAGWFVPKLPLDVPRRGFELYTWMAAFRAEELICDASPSELEDMRKMEPEEIEKTMGELKFRYNVSHRI